MPSWGVFRGTPRTVHKIYLMMATAYYSYKQKDMLSIYFNNPLSNVLLNLTSYLINL